MMHHIFMKILLHEKPKLAPSQEIGSSCDDNVVRLPGFEPGLEAWKASILDQSRPQPHDASFIF
jgi:hypothetical protein